jgi:hypothetical protein
METTTLTINISPEVQARLAERAKNSGQDIVEYVEVLVAEQISRPTLDEILAPVRREFAESGMTEDELDEFLYSMRRKVKEEKQVEAT